MVFYYVVRMIQTAPISASSRIVGYRGQTADKQYRPGAIPAWFMTWYTYTAHIKRSVVFLFLRISKIAYKRSKAIRELFQYIVEIKYIFCLMLYVCVSKHRMFGRLPVSLTTVILYHFPAPGLEDRRREHR